MFYAHLTISDVYLRFKEEFKWHLWSPIGSKKLGVKPESLALVQYLNVLRPACINIISNEETLFLLTEQITHHNDFFSAIKSVNGFFIFCDDTATKLKHFVSHLQAWSIPYLMTEESSAQIQPILTTFIHIHLAPQVIQHGTFLEVFGKGVLLTGESGVGKSLAALYCLERQHCLIADDAPSFKRVGTQIFGECPKELLQRLEIRQIGIIDVSHSFGSLAFAREHRLDLVIQINADTAAQATERVIALNPETVNIWGIQIPKIQLAFNPNIAILIEQAIRFLLTKQT
ncbi:hypothetical protein CC99x_010015 [Candidatus Berkiella cookevillensis]|uniref:HPr kinase/phosphorylase n=1 Tax=Candidatus Berkiella cookevillensis TaxID=437022 RepID=A0A0Q9YPW0_9GAMM|nr:hypothetical protein [Candidatus Berkiella cookevillensis]MCS5709240.1 hypothetical protein [Candidatus Berkiella cookevillensis]